VANLRAGVPVELVARQLGHRDATMVLKVYGRFVPHDVEWNYWREQVAGRQREELGRGSAVDSAAAADGSRAREDEAPATPSEREGSNDSRGGTRAEGPTSKNKRPGITRA
jgi:hypothetical protein